MTVPWTRFQTEWGRAALHALYCGQTPWWLPAGATLRTLLELPEVADLYYELAEWDAEAAEALCGSLRASDALRRAGFETRVARYFDEPAPVGAFRAAAVLGTACAVLLVASLVARTPSSVSPGDDAFSMRGSADTAQLAIDLLCLDADGTTITPDAASGPRLTCPHDAIVQPLVRNERATRPHVAAFVVQTGPVEQVVPMLPNPGETAPVRLEPTAAEQRLGPARRLAVHYEPSPGFYVMVVSETPIDWTRMADALQRVEQRPRGAALHAVVTAAFEARLGRAPRAVIVRPFDVTPASP